MFLMSSIVVTIIVVGDEILKGQLHSLGVNVRRTVVVPDAVSAIAEEVERAAKCSTYVITCGGIGPTHDDVTYEGVASALGVELVKNSKMATWMKKFTGSKDAGKMAMVPANASLVLSSPSDFPVVRAGNVFILPGIPQYCEHGFSHIQHLFASDTVQFFNQDLKVKEDETVFLKQLNQTVDKFVDRVALGSYPYCTAGGSWHTRITFESTNVEDLCRAKSCLLSSLSPEMIDNELDDAGAKRVLNLAKGNTPFSKAVDTAVKVVEEALEKYSFENIVLSFNGGKDCTALLHLIWAVGRSRGYGRLPTIYVKCSDPFPEITSFVDSCVARYNLDMDTVEGPIKPALEDLVARKPHIKAVWMGTRRGDPHGQKLKSFQMCDDGWPKLMRVNPLLEWSYEDVWTFLRCLGVSYCTLYDEGYTSLGSKPNTFKNPALLDKASNTYKPAYTLTNGTLERNGRT